MPYDKHGKVVGTAAQRKAYDLRHRRKLSKGRNVGQAKSNTLRDASRPDTSPGGPVQRNYAIPTKQKRDFQPYAAGKPVYGGGRSMPNIGRTANKEGYAERDLTKQAYRDRAVRLLAAKRKRNG